MQQFTYMEKNITLSDREEAKTHEMHDTSSHQPNESPFTVVNIALDGFGKPITVIWSGKFEKFENFWMSSTIDWDILNATNAWMDDS